ncbi:hypothetical protein ABPG77_003286 [Micractinium sp. CCAP 211/92]
MPFLWAAMPSPAPSATRAAAPSGMTTAIPVWPPAAPFQLRSSITGPKPCGQPARCCGTARWDQHGPSCSRQQQERQQPARSARWKPTEHGGASQPPMQLLLSIAKPLVLPLSAYLGCRLLAGLPAADAARLAGLALAAQLAVATALRVTASCTRHEAALLIREQQRGLQERRVAQVTAEDRAEAQFEFLEFKILGCCAAAATVVWHLLSAAAQATGIAAAVQSALGVGAGLPANFELDLPKLLFMLAFGPAFRALYNTWWARRSFKRAAAERRKQHAERLSKGTQQGPAAQQ